MRPDVPSRAVWVRLGAFVGLLVVAVIAVTLAVPDGPQLRETVTAAGPLAPVLFVFLYALATLAPLPKNVLSAVAGLLFGIVAGTVVVLIAALLGAVVAFALGRLLGRAAVERLLGPRVARADALLRRRGLLAILSARLIPVVPFTLINYVAGLSAVGVRDYVVGTALGIVPGTVVFVALGAYGTAPASWPFVLAVAALLVLTLVGGALARRGQRRAKPGTAS